MSSSLVDLSSEERDARSPDPALRVLGITEDLDQPTSALFAGLARAGVEIAVICSEGAPRRSVLA